MKNLLKILTSLTLTSTAAMSAVACGTKDEGTKTKTDISTLLKITEVDGNDFNTEKEVLNKIVELNDIEASDIKITSFHEATTENDGSAIISGKADSKYTGQVNIVISKLNYPEIQINKEEININIGEEVKLEVKNIKELKQYGELNVTRIGGTDYIDYKIDQDTGIITLTGKKETNETRNIKINIDGNKNILPVEIKYNVIDSGLHTVITETEVDGNKFNTEEEVLNEILNLNKDLTSNDIDIKDFDPALSALAGSATIFAKEDSKYNGEVKITISPLNNEELNEIIKNIKIAADKERYGEEYVEAYKEYFKFVQKLVEEKFEKTPFVLKENPTEDSRFNIIDQLEIYIRSIRTSHYKLGLVVQGVYIFAKEGTFTIDPINNQIIINKLPFHLHNYDIGQHVPNSRQYINTNINYIVI